MPRNRSERSVSGDPVIDEYLRAFLRLNNTPWQLRDTPEARVLRKRHNNLCDALNNQQRHVINSLGCDGALTLRQCRELFKHEPEFASAP